MKKYNCSLVYQNGARIEAKNVTFKKRSLEDFKLFKKAENIYKLLESSVDKVDFISRLLIINGANVIMSIGGDAPHEKLINHVGFWEIKGKNVLPLSFFKTVPIKVIEEEEKERKSKEKPARVPKKLGKLKLEVIDKQPTNVYNKIVGFITKKLVKKGNKNAKK